MEVTREQILQSLRLFNEKAEKLAQTSFSRTVLFESTGWSTHAKVGEPAVVERRGPPQESIEAFVLTFRLFVNKSDLCSLHKVTEAYSQALIRQELRQAFFETQRCLSDYLASPSPFRTENTCLTHGQILDTFMWGGLAHANVRYKQQYDEWISLGSLSEIHWNQLVIILGTYLKFIIHLHDLNAKVIVALGETP
ncbi:MAG: hypothetical protein ABFE08_02215 [Armatimonadia bacterium]